MSGSGQQNTGGGFSPFGGHQAVGGGSGVVGNSGGSNFNQMVGNQQLRNQLMNVGGGGGVGNTGVGGLPTTMNMLYNQNNNNIMSPPQNHPQMHSPMTTNLPQHVSNANTVGGIQSPSRISPQQSSLVSQQSQMHTQQQHHHQQQQQHQQYQQQSPQTTSGSLQTLQTPTVPNPPSAVQTLLAQQQQNVGNAGVGGVTSTSGLGMMPQQQQNPAKDFNIVSLCKFGQETVQDILSRFQEVFATLKNVQPPSTSIPPQTATPGTEKKVTEQFRTIRLLFKRLRLLFEKCINDSCQQGMEYTHIESLIPLKDEPDHKPEPAPSEEYKKHLQEHRELTEMVMLKNKQLREVIDRMRIIIWEINTMINMRKS